jgi:hypothetical protein
VISGAKALEKRILADAPKLDDDSVATMKSRGLSVTMLDPAQTVAFRVEAEKLVVSIRGMMPPEIYDAAVRERDAYRKRK